MIAKESTVVERSIGFQEKTETHFLILPPQGINLPIQLTATQYYKPEALKYSKEEENEINSLCKTKLSPVPVFKADRHDGVSTATALQKERR
jgi:hypothetical protein